MAAPKNVPLTPGLVVSGDYIIRVTALDPATGNLVNNVKISAGAVTGQILAGQVDNPSPMPVLVPQQV